MRKITPTGARRPVRPLPNTYHDEGLHSALAAAGGASTELQTEAALNWQALASNFGIDLSSFEPDAPIENRLAWAKGQGLGIATVLSRFSSDDQHSTSDQVRECLTYAAKEGWYVPPEFINADEGTTGRKVRRAGLDRTRRILRTKEADVLLVFKLSRLFRQTYKGFEFLQEEVIEQGLRGISVSQGVDTADVKTWRVLTVIHGLSDSILLEAMADHVRAGLVGIAQRGYVIGALPIGYRRKEIVEAPVTKRGLPRCVPEVDPDAARHIRKAFESIRDGMSLRDARRQWIRDGGPFDPRATTKSMTSTAFRRMLANERYRGCWTYGKSRSVWSTSRDYVQQVPQSPEKVVVQHNEALRIVDDELFFAVQHKLASLKKKGTSSPKRRVSPRIWDLVTEVFYCASCGDRFYMNGGDCKGMRCKNGPDCPQRISLRRENAVKAVCQRLCELIRNDKALIAQVIVEAQQLSLADRQELECELEKCRRSIVRLTETIELLLEMSSEGTVEDRTARKARIRSAEHQRAGLRTEEARLQAAAAGNRAAITEDRVIELLSDYETLLAEGLAGSLDEAAVFRAAEVFKQLVGGRIDVQTVPRPGRSQPYVRGTFTPRLLETGRGRLGGISADNGTVTATTETLWLREIPRSDRFAERAHRLVRLEGLSLRSAAEALRADVPEITYQGVKHLLRRYDELSQLEQPLARSEMERLAS